MPSAAKEGDTRGFRVQTHCSASNHNSFQEWNFKYVQIYSKTCAWVTWNLRNNMKSTAKEMSKEELCTCFTLFCQFLYRPSTATTWNDQVFKGAFFGENSKTDLWSQFIWILHYHKNGRSEKGSFTMTTARPHVEDKKKMHNKRRMNIRNLDGLKQKTFLE